MATLATIFNRVAASPAREAADTRGELRTGEDVFRLRPIPNEDIYFFAKQIDNSRVIRQEDPAARGNCWRYLFTATLAVALLTSILVPGALSYIHGYSVQALKEERQRLMNERTLLELDEAKLLSPQRLEELARAQQFIDPAPASVVYLDGNGETVALNHPADGK